MLLFLTFSYLYGRNITRYRKKFIQIGLREQINNKCICMDNIKEKYLIKEGDI